MGKKAKAKERAEKKARKAEKKAAKQAKRAEKKARKVEKKAAKQAGVAAKKATKKVQDAPIRKSNSKSLKKSAKSKSPPMKPGKANPTGKKATTVAKPKKVPNTAAQGTQRPAQEPAAPVTPATPGGSYSESS